ncbi:MAG: hypothetical protein ABWZ98_09015 [Nakamurella sp.]
MPHEDSDTHVSNASPRWPCGPTATEQLLRRVVGDDAAATAEILNGAATSTSAPLLVAAAMLTGKPGDYLTGAARHATTSRDRQLVQLATAHLAGDSDLLDALVREHLADYPDNILAAWIAAQRTVTGQPAKSQQEQS